MPELMPIARPKSWAGRNAGCNLGRRRFTAHCFGRRKSFASMTSAIDFRSRVVDHGGMLIDVADVTRILDAIQQGDAHASEQLLPLVYDELRKLAAQKMAREKPGLTLQATALVHEAYVRLVDDETARHWDSRGHFFAAAAEAMRRILVDAARRRGTEKRGGQLGRIDLPEVAEPTTDEPVDLLALDEALTRLEALHPEKAQVVKLRFFAGCTLEETAQAIGIARATAQRHWAFARAWLFGQLNKS